MMLFLWELRTFPCVWQWQASTCHCRTINSPSPADISDWGCKVIKSEWGSSEGDCHHITQSNENMQWSLLDQRQTTRYNQSITWCSTKYGESELACLMCHCVMALHQISLLQVLLHRRSLACDLALTSFTLAWGPETWQHCCALIAAGDPVT